jgi:hypothetical protein
LERSLGEGIFLVLVVLLLLEVHAVPAQPATPLASFSDALNPGESREHALRISQDLDEYLFYAASEGGTTADDTFDVTIQETDDTWSSLQGQLWFFSSNLNAGDYTLIVQAYEDATGPITYTVAFYSIPTVPVAFSGHVLAASAYDTADFEVDFPVDGTYTFRLGVQGEPYEVRMDYESLVTVEAPKSISVEVLEGRRYFEVISVLEQETYWSIEMSQPITTTTQTTEATQTSGHLSVSILSSCPTLNESAGQFSCILGAQAIASDGGSPEITYAWSKTGGSFNSTTGQWVNWTAPVTDKPLTFTVSVVASASGYDDGVALDSIAVQPIPEFPALSLPCLLSVLAVASLLIRRKLPRSSSR